MDRLIRWTLLATLLAIGHGAVAAAPSDCRVAADGEIVPITSLAALDAWLAARCPSPLDVMPPGSRTRFLEGLVFNDRGLSRFSTAELDAELTHDELRDVMRLFGLNAPATLGLLEEEADRLRAARAAEPVPDHRGIEASFDTLQGALNGLVARDAAAAGAIYAPLFPEESRKATIAAASSHDLRLLYRAARTTAWHSRANVHLEAMADTLDELERRGLATRNEIRAMNAMLIKAGRLEQSRKFSSRHVAAGLLPLPPVIAPEAVANGVPSALDVSAAEHALLHEVVELAPLRIIVVASPGCGFSRAAAKAIPADPELGPIFAKHAVWLAAPGELAGLDALRSWNQNNPKAALRVAASSERWPMLALDSYPQFHIFRDGQLMQSVSGWPTGEGNRDAILAALRAAGALDAHPTAQSPSE